MSIIDNIKNVADIVRKADNIDLYRQILDLQKEALDLVLENVELRNEINELKSQADLSESLAFEDNQYFIKKSGELEGPYCTSCWDSNNKLVRLHKTTPYGVEMFICPVCVKN